MLMTLQNLLVTKEIIKRALSRNLSKKLIVHTCNEIIDKSIKKDIYSWQSLTSLFEGSLIMINSEIERLSFFR